MCKTFIHFGIKAKFRTFGLLQYIGYKIYINMVGMKFTVNTDMYLLMLW